MSRATFGKSLKGSGIINPRVVASIEDAIFNSITTGGIPLQNIEINGGTIDGVVIGGNLPGPGVFTTLQSGNPSGQGFSVCFYGQSVGDSACWEPVVGRWNIQGELLVRDISDLGNIRIGTNTISSTNINGNIIIDPNGTGLISLIGPISHTTPTGNIVFNATTGLYNLTTGNTITTTSGTDTFLRSTNGDITLRTGLSIPTRTINMISTGTNPTITTTVAHGFEVGDTVVINSTNSVPNINGTFNVTSVPSTTTFRIIPGFSITGVGTTGNVLQHNDIFLTATNNVNIPVNVGLTFGGDTQNIKGNASNEITISTGGDINLTPSTGFDINVPNNIGLIFGSDTRKIESDGTDIILDTGMGEFIVNGDLRINGTTTTIKSTVTTIDDPVITLGGDTAPLLDDNKDRGVEFRYHTGISSKIGFFGFDDSSGCFTFIPDAVNTNEVFTGSVGCINVGNITSTGLNLQGGSITNAATLNVCNISCPTSLSLSSPSTTTTGTLTSSGNFTANGGTNTINGTTLNINNTTTNISSTNTLLNDLIVTIGGIVEPISDDNKDRGIEFRYHDGSISKLGFFGWDDSLECFTFIADATNTSNLISGALGDVCFGTGNFSEINTCNINCSGTLTLSGTTGISLSSTSTTTTGTFTSTGNFTANGETNTINGTTLDINNTTTNIGSTNTLLNDLIVTIGGITEPISDDNKDKGIEFRYHDGSISKLGFFGWDDSLECFTFIADATNTSNVISGALGDVCFGTGDFSEINTCNINCSGTLTLSGTTGISLSSPSTTATGSLTSAGTLTSTGDFTANGETNTINGTTLNINNTTTNISSTNTLLNDLIVTIGGITEPISDDNKDKGIEFRYHDGSISKLGFFGWDDSSECFTFIADATNTSNVISGALGDVCFGTGNFSEINTCNINCSGTLTLSGTTGITLSTEASGIFTINSNNVNIDDPIITLGEGIDDNKDRGVEFQYNDGVSSKTAFFGWDDSEDCFTFLKDTTNTNEVITGTLGKACFGDTTVNNLEVTGTITGGGVGTTKEHIIVPGSTVANPSANINITFITILTSGTVTGILTAPTTDGFEKYILISSLFSGSKYELSCPSGILVDPGSGTSAAKKITFEYSGQSIYIIWDNIASHYIIVSGNACIGGP